MRPMPALPPFPTVVDYNSVRRLYEYIQEFHEVAKSDRAQLRRLIDKLCRASSLYTITNRTESRTLDCDSTTAEINADVLGTLIVDLRWSDG